MVAMATFDTLNRICTGIGRVFDRQKDWKIVAVQAISMVSGRLSSTTPIRINRKFTDIVPVTPGRFTLHPEASVEIRK